MLYGYAWIQERTPKRRHVFKRDELHAYNLLIISKLNSQINRGESGGPVWSFNEEEILHLDIEQDIHIISGNRVMDMRPFQL